MLWAHDFGVWLQPVRTLQLTSERPDVIDGVAFLPQHLTDIRKKIGKPQPSLSSLYWFLSPLGVRGNHTRQGSNTANEEAE